ncbi:deoxyribodipyrimidine photo-lyase [Pantoea sp. Aalb]|uniref:deoxyribodipyrimidine photo-lyase n=1 Tax=Pantoea sp. Aalb TaxID=2576762 RepID=UPI00132BC42C|nr:deoxyribodipyrimidine photo-lyase [Pantoea sp. Aalb]MXP67541.1 deoxyribodipyrimidine photo-lyase [Pantoea sp. Aalb]
MKVHLVWIRDDLRINDNPALTMACYEKSTIVIALFIATPGQWYFHDVSPKQVTFIYQNLCCLQKELTKLGIFLHYHQSYDFAASLKYLLKFCDIHQVNDIYYNYQYEINERKRDEKLEKKLKEKGIICHGFDNSLLSPGVVRTKNNKMFKKFTPFRKVFIKYLHHKLPDCFNAPQVRCKILFSNHYQNIPPFDYPLEHFDFSLFPPGEKAALNQLDNFIEKLVQDYSKNRDIPIINGTSRLSPYLTIGVLSPRQCLYSLLKKYPHVLYGGIGFTWLNELIWREFYRHLIVAFPMLCKHQPFIKWTSKIHWNKNLIYFNAWKEGKTGYPIVDAGMRQLNKLGWMHNRLRMITSSFLVKDLMIDWQCGERYFMQKLIDGNLAANNGGWQWIASTGASHLPYFRILSPIVQSKKFDKQGIFIRQWLPELKDVPNNAIHEPHIWAKKNNKHIDYPKPIVEHKNILKNIRNNFEKARNNGN